MSDMVTQILTPGRQNPKPLVVRSSRAFPGMKGYLMTYFSALLSGKYDTQVAVKSLGYT